MYSWPGRYANATTWRTTRLKFMIGLNILTTAEVYTQGTSGKAVNSVRSGGEIYDTANACAAIIPGLGEFEHHWAHWEYCHEGLVVLGVGSDKTKTAPSATNSSPQVSL